MYEFQIFCGCLFDPSEHRHTTQTSKFSIFNRASTNLNNVLNVYFILNIMSQPSCKTPRRIHVCKLP